MIMGTCSCLQITVSWLGELRADFRSWSSRGFCGDSFAVFQHRYITQQPCLYSELPYPVSVTPVTPGCAQIHCCCLWHPFQPDPQWALSLGPSSLSSAFLGLCSLCVVIAVFWTLGGWCPWSSLSTHVCHVICHRTCGWCQGWPCSSLAFP